MAVPVCGPLCCPSSSSAKKVQIMRVMMTITPRPIRRCVPTGAWSLAGADILVWHTKHAKFNQISSSSPPVTYRPIQRFQFNNKKGRHFPLFFYKKNPLTDLMSSQRHMLPIVEGQILFNVQKKQSQSSFLPQLARYWNPNHRRSGERETTKK